MKLSPFLITGTLLLSNCQSYIAYQAFDRAEYTAFCDTADIRPEAKQVILTDGSHYYMELPRHRRHHRTFDYAECLGSKFHMGEISSPVPGETDLYQLPANFARYLTGRSKTQPKQVVLKYVADAESVRTRCKTELAITRACDVGTSGCFTYTSPNAGIYKAAGYPLYVVDTPLTVAGSIGLAGAFTIGGTLALICYPIASCF